MRNTVTPLKGGFIQLWTDPTMLQADTWKAVVGEMHELKMDTIVIQYMEITSKNGEEQSFLPGPSNGDVSPAALILAEANKLNMKVFLGLYNGPLSGDPSITRKSGYLDGVRQRSMELARTIFGLYEDQPSFYGWYIPTESWTGKYTKADLAEWNKFYKVISDSLKQLSPSKKILISPFISQKSERSSPSKTQENYTQILAKTKIDFMALQDGIGANATTIDLPKVIQQHFKYMKRACQANNIDLWGNIESFQKISISGDDNLLIPTRIDRFSRQNRIASMHVKNLITFDFFLYMNSKIVLDSDIWSDTYVERIQTLNRRYRESIGLRS